MYHNVGRSGLRPDPLRELISAPQTYSRGCTWPLAARPAEGNLYSPQITIPPIGFNHKSRPDPDTHFNYTTAYGKSFDYNDQGIGEGIVAVGGKGVVVFILG